MYSKLDYRVVLTYNGSKNKQGKNSMRAVVISRVSDEMQLDGYSIDAQYDRLKAYCQARDLTVAEEDTIDFQESAWVAKNRKRFRQIIETLKRSKEPVAIVCDKVDRLLRNLSDLNDLNQLLEKGKVELHFVSEHMALTQKSSANEKLFFTMMVAWAKNYSDQISENVKRSKERMAKEGKLSTVAPFGYRWAHTTDSEGRVTHKDVLPDEAKEKYLLKIFELRVYESTPFEDIGKRLHEFGYHRILPCSTIEWIIRNPFYVGYLKDKHGNLYPHNYKRIVPDELWHACQVKKPKVKHTNMYISSGIFKHYCGAALSPYRATKTGKIYLVCAAGKYKCPGVNIAEDILLGEVEKVLKLMKFPKEYEKEVLDGINKAENIALTENRERLQAIRSEMIQVQQQMDGLIDMRVKGELDNELFQPRLTKLKATIKTLENQEEKYMDSTEKVAHTTATLLDLCRNAYRLFSESSKTEVKNQILRALFRTAIVDTQKQVKFELNEPYSELFFSYGGLDRIRTGDPLRDREVL
jgi:site-specific DNA recombinase